MNQSDLDSSDENLDVLQNLEFAVVAVWHQHPEMNNYHVMRAYDAAIEVYRALARDQTSKPVKLTGLDALLFESIKEICEWRLGRVAKTGETEMPAISAEVLVGCLRKLRKSVDRWTQRGGRQGYLQFIEKFLPG